MKTISLICLLILFSCQGESPHAWIGHLNNRYVDEHNNIRNNYLIDVVFPIEMGLTQKQIFIFEEANSKIIDENRRIGTIMECQEVK
jgi:hypothetical protein